MASIGSSNTAVMRKASGRLGSNFPFSIETTVCRETPRRVASSDWVQPRVAHQLIRRLITMEFTPKTAMP